MNIEQGLVELDIELAPSVIERLTAYLTLLGKWNRTYNLTAIRDMEQMVTHHLLDSLVLLPQLGGVGRLADVGSGAGLPGIPLAIASPGLQVESIEASQKKVAFQRQAKIELNLNNFHVHGGRVEHERLHCDAVVSRAFTSLGQFVGLAGHLAPRLLAMKGGYPDAEIQELPDGWRVSETIPLRVPGLAAARHLIVLEKS